jgi:putative transposase
VVRPSVRREIARHLQVAYEISERRACRAAGLARSSQRYQSRRDPQDELRLRLKELAAARVRYGYRRLHVLLRREGWPVNHKRTYRLYREEGLSIRSKVPRRKRAWRYRSGRPEIGGPNEVWALDFMSDQLFDGRPFRILTVLDCHTRESLAIAPRANFRAFQVVEVLDELARQRGKPRSLRVDNGPEFAGRMLDQWAYLNGVEIDFSRPGKPTDNAFIEAFNARFRTECLNASWFLSLADARDRIEQWRCHYNDDRPHTALGGLTPRAFAIEANRARELA